MGWLPEPEGPRGFIRAAINARGTARYHAGHVGRALSHVATVIGLLTGVGTIVGWAASQDLAETADTVLPIAGAAFIAIALGIAAREVIREFRGGDTVEVLLSYGVLLLLSLALLTAPRQGIVDVLLKPMGFVALAFAAIQAPRYVLHRIRMYRLSRRECPDCKEVIRADANVCHYCGYRFRPVPLLTDAVVGEPTLRAGSDGGEHFARSP